MMCSRLFTSSYSVDNVRVGNGEVGARRRLAPTGSSLPGRVCCRHVCAFPESAHTSRQKASRGVRHPSNADLKVGATQLGHLLFCHQALQQTVIVPTRLVDHGISRVKQDEVIQRSIQALDALGVPRLVAGSWLDPPNRRIRPRMYGGVGGASGRPLAPSRSVLVSSMSQIAD